MRKNELEAKVYSIVERVKAGQPIETISLTEEWMVDAKKAARNWPPSPTRQTGEPVLWL